MAEKKLSLPDPPPEVSRYPMPEPEVLAWDGGGWRAGLVPESDVRVCAAREDAARDWFFLRLESPPQ